MSALDPVVSRKLVLVNEALAASGLPYAFGGAIALGYCVADPRGTHDLVFRQAEGLHDVANMVEARSFDVSEVRRTIASLLGRDARELEQFDAAVADGRDPDRNEPRNRFSPPSR